MVALPPPAVELVSQSNNQGPLLRGERSQGGNDERVANRVRATSRMRARLTLVARRAMGAPCVQVVAE